MFAHLLTSLQLPLVPLVTGRGAGGAGCCMAGLLAARLGRSAGRRETQAGWVSRPAAQAAPVLAATHSCRVGGNRSSCRHEGITKLS